MVRWLKLPDLKDGDLDPRVWLKIIKHPDSTVVYRQPNKRPQVDQYLKGTPTFVVAIMEEWDFHIRTRSVPAFCGH